MDSDGSSDSDVVAGEVIIICHNHHIVTISMS